MSPEIPTADILSVETPESVAFAYELAGLGSRGLALLIDTLIIIAIVIGEAALFGLAAYITGRVSPHALAVAGPWLAGALIVVVFVTTWAYFIVGEGLRNGRTWGKKRLGIRVVRDDGSRLRVGDAVIRNLVRLIDFLPGSYAVGMFSILLTKRNKRVGDLAAGTVVIRDTGDDELGFVGGGVAPQVLLAREFLDRRPMLTEAARWQVGVEVLRAFGEEPAPTWDEPLVAGRIADLSGWREAR